MTPHTHIVGKVAALAALTLALATPALAAQSSAYTVSAELSTDGGSPVQLPQQLLTSGTTVLGQSYDKPLSAALISKSVRLLPTLLRSPTLIVMAQRAATDAAGANGVDAINTSATSAAASGVVALTLYPLMPIDPPQPVVDPLATASSSEAADATLARPPFALFGLRVQFSKLKATANYSQVFPGPSRRSGTTTFGEVSISGQMLGSKPLRFSGNVQPNTVVLQTPTLKITLNAQTIPQQPVCEPNKLCPLYRILETVETKAVLIELNNAAVLGHRVTGSITIGDAEAGQ